MDWKLGGLSLALLAGAVFATGCGSSADEGASFESYEDCILGKLGRGQSKLATEAIIQACRAKFPVDSEAPKERPASDKGLPEGVSAIHTHYRILMGYEFHGYQCTDDCSGRIAAQQWAKDRGIDSGHQCVGSSESFNEGCLAFVNGR